MSERSIETNSGKHFVRRGSGGKFKGVQGRR
jgi:hypothetical protein